jgi:hypothetical protein
MAAINAILAPTTAVTNTCSSHAIPEINKNGGTNIDPTSAASPHDLAW